MLCMCLAGVFTLAWLDLPMQMKNPIFKVCFSLSLRLLLVAEVKEGSGQRLVSPLLSFCHATHDTRSWPVLPPSWPAPVDQYFCCHLVFFFVLVHHVCFIRLDLFFHSGHPAHPDAVLFFFFLLAGLVGHIGAARRQPAPDTKRQEVQPTISMDNSNKPTAGGNKNLFAAQNKQLNKNKNEYKKNLVEKGKFLLFGLARHLFVSRCLLPCHKIEFSLLNNWRYHIHHTHTCMRILPVAMDSFFFFFQPFSIFLIKFFTWFVFFSSFHAFQFVVYSLFLPRSA